MVLKGVIALAALAGLAVPSITRPQVFEPYRFESEKHCKDNVCTVPEPIMYGIVMANVQLQQALRQAHDELAAAQRELALAEAALKRKCTARLEVIPGRRT